MSAYFTSIGAQLARARLSVAGSIGVTLLFSHRAVSAVNISAQILSDRNELLEEGGVVTERRTLTTLISTGQNGFTAPTNPNGDVEPIVQGDKMVYENRTWYCVGDVVKDKFGTRYTVKWCEKKRAASGAA